MPATPRFPGYLRDILDRISQGWPSSWIEQLLTGCVGLGLHLDRHPF